MAVSNMGIRMYPEKMTVSMVRIDLYNSWTGSSSSLNHWRFGDCLGKQSNKNHAQNHKKTTKNQQPNTKKPQTKTAKPNPQKTYQHHQNLRNSWKHKKASQLLKHLFVQSNGMRVLPMILYQAP